jgi:hypothetical protein
MVAGIVARRVEHRQDAEQRPAFAAVARARDGERPVSPAGEVGDGLFDRAGDVGGGLRERDDRLRRSLRHRERRSLRTYDRRLGPLRYRIERNEIGTAVGVERMGVLERRDDRAVDGVAVAGLGGERRGEDDVLRILRRQEDRLAQGELILGQRTGLVRTEDVDPGHLLDRRQPRDDRLLSRQGQGAQRHGDREYRRHRHRDRGDQQDQHELQDVQCVRHTPIVGDDDVAIDAHGDHDQRQHHGDRDQEISDLQHRLLGVAHCAGAGDELGGAAEEGVRASGDDHAAHRALFHYAAGISLIAGPPGDGERLAGQGSLVDEEVSFSDQAQVGGNDGAESDVDNVSRHQGGRIDGGDLSVAQRCGLERQAFLQRGERVRGLHVLPELEAGVEQ